MASLYSRTILCQTKTCTDSLVWLLIWSFSHCAVICKLLAALFNPITIRFKVKLFCEGFVTPLANSLSCPTNTLGLFLFLPIITWSVYDCGTGFLMKLKDCECYLLSEQNREWQNKVALSTLNQSILSRAAVGQNDEGLQPTKNLWMLCTAYIICV